MGYRDVGLSSGSGQIWPCAQTPVGDSNGIVLRISCLAKVSTAPSIGFRAAAVNPNGTLLAAVEEKGGLYILYLTQNRFALVDRAGPAGQAICFVPNRQEEVLRGVGNKVRGFDACSRRLVATLAGHTHDIVSIGAAAHSGLVVSQSVDAVILWEPVSWTRMRTLWAQEAQIAAVGLSPSGDAVGVLFRRGRVAVWDTGSWVALSEVHAPKLDGQPTSLQRVVIGQKSIICSGGGLEGFLFCWPRHGAAGVACVQTPYAIQELAVRNVRWKGKGALNEAALLLHVGGVDAVDINSRQVLVSFDSPNVSHWSIDDHGEKILLLRSGGGLELRDVCCLLKSTVTRKAAMQPQQGPRRFPKVSEERITDYKSAAALVAERVADGAIAKMLVDVGVPKPSSQQVAEPNASSNRFPKHASFDAAIETLSARELRGFVLRRGAFPEKHRCVAWELLLQLPGNLEAYASLATKGVHPRYEDLSDRFPMHGTKALRRLARLLSALTFWEPALAELPWLPGAVFPFALLFEGNPMTAFEVSAFFCLNWMRMWLDNYPLPPVGQLQKAATLLEATDKELFEHFCELNVQVENDVLWPLLRTLFTEILVRDDWLALWDHLVTHWPDPLLHLTAVVALLVTIRTTLLAVPLHKPFLLTAVLSRQQVICMSQFLKHLYTLHPQMKKLKVSGAGEKEASGESAALPMRQGSSYPLLLEMPHYVLDYQVSERKRMDAEAEQMRLCQALAKRKVAMAKQLAEDEEKYQEQENEIMVAEEARQKTAEQQTKQLENEMRQIDEKLVESRLDAVDTLRESAQKSLEVQRKRREADATRVLEDLERQKRSQAYATDRRLQEEDLLGLELKGCRQISEVLQQRRAAEVERQMHQEVELKQREHKVQDELQQQLWRIEDERERKILQGEYERRMEAQQMAEAEQNKRRILAELQLQDLDRQVQLAKVAQQRLVRNAEREAFVANETARQTQVQRYVTGAAEEARAQDMMTAEELRRHEERLAEQKKILEREQRRATLDRELRNNDERERELEEERRQFRQRAALLSANEAEQVEEDERRFQAALIEIDGVRQTDVADAELLEQRRALRRQQKADQKLAHEMQSVAIDAEREQLEGMQKKRKDRNLQGAQDRATATEEELGRLIALREAELAALDADIERESKHLGRRVGHGTTARSKERSLGERSRGVRSGGRAQSVSGSPSSGSRSSDRGDIQGYPSNIGRQIRRPLGSSGSSNGSSDGKGRADDVLVGPRLPPSSSLSSQSSDAPDGKMLVGEQEGSQGLSSSQSSPSRGAVPPGSDRSNSSSSPDVTVEVGGSSSASSSASNR